MFQLSDFGTHYRAVGWIGMVTVVAVFFLCYVLHICWSELFFQFWLPLLLSSSGCSVFLILPRVMSVWSSAIGSDENSAGHHRVPKNILNCTLNTKETRWCQKPGHGLDSMRPLGALVRTTGSMWLLELSVLQWPLGPQKLRQQFHTGLWDLHIQSSGLSKDSKLTEAGGSALLWLLGLLVPEVWSWNQRLGPAKAPAYF